ncbi:Transcription factor RF2b [Hibiscus syriacus]|uniref:Transcription factor RF2b n=1 Tax=Hibiscus syriacus TaxID=106335 RepID=A0A6A3BMF3_HIBSY|nr:bZIP transcription factor 18-like [Hibiscus syriacus]KAE8717824.1 Transcription factor RF2b [Hibiscus syriacus]
MQDPPSIKPEELDPSNASSTTQTPPTFPNPSTFRASSHRRAHSEVQFRIPDDLDLVSDPFEGIGSEEDLFCSYMDIEKLGGGSKGVDDGGGAAGSSSAGSGHNPKGDEMSGESGMGEKSNEGGKGRHRYSNSVDGCSLMESIEAKKAMAPDKLDELWTVDPKRAKRIIANRQSAARSKERKARYISELERKVQTLQTEATTLSAQLTLFQRDTTGLTTENTELKLRLQAMEQQAQLRDALNEALKKEVERLKMATGEMLTPTDNFNLGMHHMPFSQPSFFPPQPRLVESQNMQMPPFHPLQSNMLTPNQSVVAASNSLAFADMMQQDPLGQLQGLDISSRDTHLAKAEGPSISAGESSGTL